MPGFSEILLWGGGSVAFAILGLYLVKRFISPIDIRGDMEFLVAVVTIVGTLVSVVLGLLVSSSVDQYRTAEANADQEATSVLDIYRMSRGLPAKSASLLQSLCIDYCEDATKYEWPAMRHGKISKELTGVAAKLNDIIVSFHPANESEAGIQQALLPVLTQIDQNRRNRAVALDSTWTRRMLPILLMCSIIILAISYIYADKKPTKVQLLLVSFVAIALGSNIGLMLEMSRPFSGRDGISPDQFETNAKLFHEFKNLPLFTGE